MRVVNGLRDFKLMTAIGIGAFVTYTSQAHADAFVQTNLVSNIAGLADVTDPALVNPWGVSESATSPFWVSDQGTNESTLVTVNSAGVSIPNLTVPTPQTASGPQGPAGQVSNSTTAFDVGTTGKPAASDGVGAALRACSQLASRLVRGLPQNLTRPSSHQTSSRGGHRPIAGLVLIL